MALLEFRFDESNAGDKVGQDVLFLGIIDFDLLVCEGLLKRLGLRAWAFGRYGRLEQLLFPSWQRGCCGCCFS